MSCPYSGQTDQDGTNNVELGGISYSDYLQLDKLLGAQKLESEVHGHAVDDEHLFIVTHQAYELWFKQIIYDLDRVIDESRTLRVVSLLSRTVRILQLLVDQMLILETMSPMDFLEFRHFLAPASGFQSLQFRLLENKLGVLKENRVQYNSQNYNKVFLADVEMNELLKSEKEMSLVKLVEKWLERTPGVSATAGEVFWIQYKAAVNNYLSDMKQNVLAKQDEKAKLVATAEYEKILATFESILDPEKHDAFVKRDNHVMLVQRQLGSKQGLGGSSGYLYLRSTISDRYKVFLDLFNLSTWLLPRAYVPQLSVSMRRKLTVCCDDTENEWPSSPLSMVNGHA